MSNTKTVSALRPKIQCFCREYLKDFNGTQAAIRAGYSKKTAREQAAQLLSKLNIQEYIKQLTNKVEQKDIMDVTEILQRLTKQARGDISEEAVVVESIGDFRSEARIVEKKITPKDQLKALELLGKANAIFTEKIQTMPPPIINDDIPRIDNDTDDEVDCDE